MTSIYDVGKIRKIEFKNRIVMAPISIGYGTKDKKVSDDMVSFYENRAKNDVGMIILGCIEINDYDSAFERHGVAIHKDEQIEGFKKLADKVHQYNCKVIGQLGHPGSQTISHLNKSKVGLSPSGKQCKVCNAKVTEMTIEDIKRIQKEIIEGTKRLKRAGLDGIELHGAHGYLINQFFSPYTNKRKDKYGGTIENRCRFVSEIMSELKEVQSEQFIVGIRVTVDEYMWMVGKDEEGLKLDEGVQIAKELEKAGIDYINVTSGIYETTNTIVEPISFKEGWRNHLSKAVKKEVKIPVIAASAIRTPQKAEEWIKTGEVDYIALGRALVADEKWMSKMKDKRMIRPCISCMYCLEAVYAGKPMTCAVNPNVVGNDLKRVGFEKQSSKSILIVGAGPAGVQAGISAAAAGNKVVIIEKEKELGGQLNYAKVPPGKEKIQWLLDYYKNEIEQQKINIKYNVKDWTNLIESDKPEQIIVACGASPITLDIEGCKDEKVITYKQVLDPNNKMENKTIAIIGSGMNGLEMAHYLSDLDNTIDIYEIDTVVGRTIYSPNRIDIMRQLQNYDMGIYTNHEVLSYKSGMLEVKNNDEDIIVKKNYDYVVMSVGAKPNKIDIKDSAKIISVIGDAKKIGRVFHAVRDGYEVAK